MPYIPPVWPTDLVWYCAGSSQNAAVTSVLTGASTSITAGTNCTTGIQTIVGYCTQEASLYGTPLYFPTNSSSYEITNTIIWYDTNTSTWAGGVQIIGAGQGNTIFEVPASTSAFSNATSPAPVFRTASQYSGTSQPEGEGNEAFGTWLQDFTLQIDAGNPGAIGIDLLSNNGGGVARVTVQSTDTNGAGYAGLLYTREYPGPCLVEDFTVIGFTTAIDFGDLGTSGLAWLYGQNRYSLTFRNLTLEQMADTVQGIRVSGNMLIIDGLTCSRFGGGAQTAPVINVNNAVGQVVVINANFGTGSGVPAINNSAGGTVYCRNCTGSGWTAMVENPGGALVPFTTAEYYSGSQLPNAWNQTNAGLDISVPSFPVYNDSSDPPSGWADVATYGAAPGSADSAADINAAMASGASTVYFPKQNSLRISTSGDTWLISTSIVVPSTVQRIIFGAGNAIEGYGAFGGNVFTFESGSNPLYIECPFNGFLTTLPMVIPPGRQIVINWVSYMTPSTATVPFPLTIQAGAGPVWLKNFIAGMYIGAGATVYAWQLNCESYQPNINAYTTAYPLGRIWNNGGTLRVVGYKTEKTGILCLTDNGGQTEILGWWQLQIAEAGPPQPVYYVNIGGAHSIVGRAQSDDTSGSPQPGAIFWDIGPGTAVQPAGLGYLQNGSCPQYGGGPIINMYSTRLIPGVGGVPASAPAISSR